MIQSTNGTIRLKSHYISILWAAVKMYNIIFYLLKAKCLEWNYKCRKHLQLPEIVQSLQKANGAEEKDRSEKTK